MKIVNAYKLATIFVTEFIVNVRLGSKHTSVNITLRLTYLEENSL